MVKNKLIAFFGLCAYVLGVLGGFGYLWWIKEKPIALCIVVLGIMAFPTAKKFWKELNT